jgi:hypothetical protein
MDRQALIVGLHEHRFVDDDSHTVQCLHQAHEPADREADQRQYQLPLDRPQLFGKKDSLVSDRSPARHCPRACCRAHRTTTFPYIW